MMKNVTIVGATGFGGLGLIEIILRHPYFRIKQLIARKDTDTPVSRVFPHLQGFCELNVDPAEKTDFNTDLVFFSTPDRAGMAMIDEYHRRNIPVIDFSGDFRFENTDEYALYARNKGMEESHMAPQLLKKAVYGLPEKNREGIKKAEIVGNPGCFAISMILGLLPAMKAGIIESDTIICDGKSGVSGAGKNSGEANLYPQRHENMNPYREGRHQHLVEVEKLINSYGNRERKIFFVPQILPISRGIMSTMYADIKPGYDTDKVQEIYREHYRNEPFIVITARSPNTSDVRGSNRCEIRSMVDPRTGKLFITSVIDNLLKGQAGNAIQVANIMMGFDETAGLNVPAFYP
jgi:N-acetyl-gamma-glutamyl-phosphate reductase